MLPIHKATVLKQVRINNQWSGYIAPSNVNHGNINTGWHIGMSIHIVYGRDGAPYVINYNSLEYVPLESCLNVFKYYNCNSELGNNIRFWEGN